MNDYRGRIAPTPTGHLHRGHACTFWTAYQRACEQGGTLVFRNEDLDPQRCKPDFLTSIIEDLQWLGIEWEEGPDVGGAYAPYTQSERTPEYLKAWRKLKEGGFIYPCNRSRKEVNEAVQAPHEDEEAYEPIFPIAWRPTLGVGMEALAPEGSHWRFRVPDGEVITFDDERCGRVSFTAGKDFGDFLVWRRDGVPAYELAVVVDDAQMCITEVVRGEDLLKSTARQLLLYRALGHATPQFYHCPLIRDEKGKRLAKRHASQYMKNFIKIGYKPCDIVGG